MDRTVVILDWDDTLCPSSWLDQHELVPRIHADQLDASLPLPLMNELYKVSCKVNELLMKATSYGPVFIVTAAERGWVEMSSELFLPDVARALQHDDVHIISARTWYETHYGLYGTAQDWKNEVVSIIAAECFTNGAASRMNPIDGQFHLISIGDSMVERDACHAAADNTPFTLAKTLKFIAKPTVDELVQQVEVALNAFDHLCNADSTLDVQLSRLHLDKSTVPPTTTNIVNGSSTQSAPYVETRAV